MLETDMYEDAIMILKQLEADLYGNHYSARDVLLAQDIDELILNAKEWYETPR